jgi:hypothetical protein
LGIIEIIFFEKKEEKLEWEKIFERDGNAWVAMDFIRRRNVHVDEKKTKPSGGKFGVKILRFDSSHLIHADFQ